jgi:RNA recognition motif-containing protein
VKWVFVKKKKREEVSMKLYVKNLAWKTTDLELKSHFEKVGVVADAKIIVDRETNRSRGFGFITMPNDEEAKAAIQTLNDTMLNSRTIFVSESIQKA